jgi:hypothetical protein
MSDGGGEKRETATLGASNLLVRRLATSLWEDSKRIKGSRCSHNVTVVVTATHTYVISHNKRKRVRSQMENFAK